MLLPFLQVLSDGKSRSHKEIVSELAEKMHLTHEQCNLRHAKSGSNILSKTVSWTNFNLCKANLVFRSSRGRYQITEDGLAILNQNLKSINFRFLRDNCPAYKDWTCKGPSDGKDIDDTPELPAKLPEELLEEAYSTICSGLEEELLDAIKGNSPAFFEHLVVDLLLKMGYGGSREDAGKIVGKSGDGGIDGVINEDKLGLDVVYIQAKRFADPVTISQVRDFAGALLAKKARKGVFITTSSFPKSAVEFVAQIEPKVVLIDGQRLAQLMIEYNVGVSVKDTYEIKRIDSDYFDENEL